MIDLSGVSKTFDRAVLTNVDLHVPRSCLFGLIGPGASGKSLLLRMITGLMRPDQGQVSVDGKDVLAMGDMQLHEYRKGIGMLFQNNALFDFMTVAENIAFPLRRLFHLPEPEIAERVAERLGRVDLPGFEGRLPAGLSGGQKKRVGVARATVTRAPIVLYDEPAAGLTAGEVDELRDVLLRLHEELKLTMVVVEHNMRFVMKTCSDLAVLSFGRKLAQGSPEEVANNDAVLDAYLGGVL